MNKFNIIESELAEHITATFAEPQELNEVQQLLFKTARWLQKKGSKQWQGLLRGDDIHNTVDAIKTKQVIIFRHDESLIGTVTIFPNPSQWDQDLWGDTEDAVYIHRITVDRTFAGRGLGRLIMHWIENGIEYEFAKKIRLDCVAHSKKLNRFYISLGYCFKGSRNGYNLYEKSIDKFRSTAD